MGETSGSSSSHRPRQQIPENFTPASSAGRVRRSLFRLRGKSARSVEGGAGSCGDLLQIGPAAGGRGRGLGPRAHSTLAPGRAPQAISQNTAGEGRLQAVRGSKEQETPDRISLDRRGLTTVPLVVVSSRSLRLLSLQHNLLCSLAGLAATPDLSSLVFLDVYNNQIERISCLEGLPSLRVLLMGKNRIRRIEGLSTCSKLEVLDLHGNRISACGGSCVSGLRSLKVLNLAGNQLRAAELAALPELRELNLKRNRLRRLRGCHHAPKLQKLFLSNNDLQSIEDICSVAMASSLREVTLDNNPVSLGGDCVSFLVSYLPNLQFLSQMQVTDQVRRSAMAWRHNREASNAAFSELGEEADANTRREQVISNARTNWELLRSQSKCLTSSTASCIGLGLPSEFILEANGVPKAETPDIIKSNTLVQFSRNATAKSANVVQHQVAVAHHNTQKNPGFGEKRVNFSHRSVSQDTDISHSTSTSSELLRLPPILVPIIDSLEHQKISLETSDKPSVGNGKFLKRWESISSVDPVINSSLSSLPTTTSESESEVTKKPPVRRVSTANRKRATFAASKSVSISDTNSNSNKTLTKNRSVSDNSENASVLSAGTNLNSIVTNSSTSGSENRVGRRENLSRAGSAKGRYIKSASTTRKSVSRAPSSRAVTARPKTSRPVVETAPPPPPPADPVVKDREQGGDWLVEVRGGQASVWGAGALRRLERAWPAATDVTTLHFHYVSFSSICAVISIIKTRFPNAVHLSFRACGVSCCGQLGALAALRGLSSVHLHREGNPLASRQWHAYALYRLAHWGLRTLDHRQVTDEEISAAQREYSGLSSVVLWSLPSSLLQPLLLRLRGEGAGAPGEVAGDPGGGRAWLWAAEPSLRDVVAREALQWRRSAMSQEEVVLRHRGRAQLQRVLCLAAGAAAKLRLLRRLWPSLLLHMVTVALQDFVHLEAHVQQAMEELLQQPENN